MEVGERILCIDDTVKADKLFPAIAMYPNWIKKDRVYTIREIFSNDGIVAGLLLEQVHNPPVFIPLIDKVQEPAFALWRFRKFTYQEMEMIKESENNIQSESEFLETMIKQN